MIRYVGSTVSTNEDVVALARAGAPHGTAVVAERQTGGKGRLGRRWESAEGNLYLSVLLRPALPVERVPLTCLGAAIAVAETCGAPYAIKWPNDVLAPDGRKVSGVLAEVEADGKAVRHVVVGVGVNLVAAPDLPTATSLRETDGLERDRVAFAESLVARLLRWTATLQCSPLAVVSRWAELSCTLGRRVRVGEVEGVAIALDPDGALRVRVDSGEERRILAGDVEMVASR